MTSPNPEPVRRVSANKYRGLGDVVASLAKPVAMILDRVAGTDLENCPACARRRAGLNRRFSLRREAVDTADEA